MVFTVRYGKSRQKTASKHTQSGNDNKRCTCPFSLACKTGGWKMGKEGLAERETSEMSFELLLGVIQINNSTEGISEEGKKKEYGLRVPGNISYR